MKKLSLSFLTALCLFAQENLLGINYESYLESWDPNWQNVVQNLPPGPGGTAANSYLGVTLNIGFACYNFPGLNGLQFSLANVGTVVSFVQTHGGKARISFGGASHAAPCAPNYFISQTAGWPSNSATLATGVLSVVSANNFDGVDFDIEDPQPSGFTPQQFANDLINFLSEVRSGLPAGKTLSITIPAQGWGTYWFYLATGVAAMPGLVDYINVMEYDIWVNPSLTFKQQIEADLLTYTSNPTTAPPPNNSPGWGIPISLIQIGLMPGCDDSKAFLSVSDAESLATKARTDGYYGVMTWDLNRDSGSINSPSCSTYPTGYQYTIGIRNILDVLFTGLSEPIEFTNFQQKKRYHVLQPFIRHSPLPMGALKHKIGILK